jgi:hypothetical protein
MSIQLPDAATPFPGPPINVPAPRSFLELTRGSFASDLPEGHLSLESSTTSYRFSDLKTRNSLDKSECLVLCPSPCTDTLKISLKRVSISSTDTETLLEKRWEFDGEFLYGSVGQKRTKSSILPTFVGDMGHCRATVPPLFAQLFGKTLFDNSISKTPARQADLGSLEGKKFKSYRSKQFSDGWSSRSTEFEHLKEDILEVLPASLGPAVTDSQVLALLTLMPTRQTLHTILDQNPTLITAFFGQFAQNLALAED